MKLILALAIAGLGATAAHAGSKSVFVTVTHTGPVYFLYNDSVMGPTYSPSTTLTTSNAAVAPVAAPRSAIDQTGYGPDTQDAVYSKLLKEAQKRGLR